MENWSRKETGTQLVQAYCEGIGACVHLAVCYTVLFICCVSVSVDNVIMLIKCSSQDGSCSEGDSRTLIYCQARGGSIGHSCRMIYSRKSVT